MDRLGIATATVSLGKIEGGHKIESILEAAARHKIRGIELVHEHLEELALRSFGSVDEQAVIRAARLVRDQSDFLGLSVFALQPFAFYDGLLDDEQHHRMLDKMHHWVVLAQILGAEIIQMPSNFATTGTTGDMDKIVADLIEVADITGSVSPPIKIAYEAVAWGTHVDLWEQSWDIVKRVNRANFGLCLDTFHMAGRVYGDPTSASGKTPNADAEYKASLDLLRRELDPAKIFYLQLSDAERLARPLIPGHELYIEGANQRMTWSRGARLFPLEAVFGGYLPVLAAIATIVNDVGYRGWISMEIFSKQLKKPNSPRVPDEYARRAAASYRRVYDALHWDGLI